MQSNNGYPQQVDCVWLAIDTNGQIGAFFTGGEGPIPSSAMAAAIADPDLEAELNTLPIISNAQMIVRYKREVSFIELGKRGLYVFDWNDVHRTSSKRTNQYALVCEPSEPLLLRTLPSHLKVIAETTRLSDAVFSDCHANGLSI